MLPSAARLLPLLLPAAAWLPNYSWETLRFDLLAGLTVGLMVIPQGLAYAQVAQLPVQYGLYSAFAGPMVYCLLGSSKDVTLGPTAIMSLMTASFNGGPGPPLKHATYAVLLCFFCGVVQLLLGLLRLGVVVSFISRPVVSAFTTSAAITIAWGQVKSLLGLKQVRSNWLPVSVYEVARDIGLTNFWDLALGCCCIAALLLLMKFDSDVRRRDQEEQQRPVAIVRAARRLLRLLCISRNAAVVIAAAFVAYSLQLQQIGKLTLTPEMSGHLPPLRPPNFQLRNGTTVVRSFLQIAGDIGVGFAVVPFIGLVETIAISKAFARQSGYRINASQELVAIGAANLIGSFLSSYPVTGSFTRTAINNQSGVRTPAGGLFTGALVILSLLLFTSAFQYIPKASLAAVIVVAVLQMTDFRLLPRLLAVRKTDAVEWLATFVVSLAFGIEYGIVVGICTSFIFLLYHFASPGTQFSVRPSGLPVLSVRSGVRFPSADRLEDEAAELADSNESELFCIDLGRAAWLDFAVVDSLLLLRTRLALADRRLLIVATDAQVHASLQAKRLEVFNSVSDLEHECHADLCVNEHSPLVPKA